MRVPRMSLPFPTHIQGWLSARTTLSPQGPGLLTQLCGQHGKVVPDTSLAVQEHCCSDSAVFGLNGEATLWIRVGEDGVSRGNGTDLGAATSPLPLLSPLPICTSQSGPSDRLEFSGRP